MQHSSLRQRYQNGRSADAQAATTQGDPFCVWRKCPWIHRWCPRPAHPSGSVERTCLRNVDHLVVDAQPVHRRPLTVVGAEADPRGLSGFFPEVLRALLSSAYPYPGILAVYRQSSYAPLYSFTLAEQRDASCVLEDSELTRADGCLEFVEQICDVSLDGMHAYVELVCDRLVAIPISYQL